jgi:hypothetical protein
MSVLSRVWRTSSKLAISVLLAATVSCGLTGAIPASAAATSTHPASSHPTIILGKWEPYARYGTKAICQAVGEAGRRQGKWINFQCAHVAHYGLKWLLWVYIR